MGPSVKWLVLDYRIYPVIFVRKCEKRTVLSQRGSDDWYVAVSVEVGGCDAQEENCLQVQLVRFVRLVK